MSNTNNLLKKLDGKLEKMTTGDFAGGVGLLPVKAADKFINFIFDESKLKNMVTQMTLDVPKKEIDILDLTEQVISPQVENTANPGTDLVNPATSKLEIDTVNLTAIWDISFDVLEENIEKGNFEKTFYENLSKKIANNLEDFHLNGDTAIAPADRRDNVLVLQDGWLKRIAAGGNTFAVPAGNPLQLAAFDRLQLALPEKYKSNRDMLKYFTNPVNEQNYRSSLVDRNTGLGDALLEGNKNISVFGSEVMPITYMPEGTTFYGASKNLISAIYRKFRVFREVKPRNGRVEFTIHFSAGSQVYNPEATAFCTGLTTVATPWLV